MVQESGRIDLDGLASLPVARLAPLAVIPGSAAADVLEGTPEDDEIDALGGADTVFGRGGHDTIFGRGGADQLRGQAGNDRIGGGAGSDSLFGGVGDDVLLGNKGRDTLDGGAGDDDLDGGLGADRLIGGAGRDTFRFSVVDGNVDSVADYVRSDDRLDLRAILPDFQADDRLADFVRFTIDGADTIVAVDQDGAGGDFVDLARLEGVQLDGLSRSELGLPSNLPAGPTLVSTNAAGDPADGLAFLPSLSGDGRFVSFASDADNLGGGGAGFDVFRKDLETGEIVLVSTVEADKSALSGDGSTVAFRSFGGGAIIVHDLAGERVVDLGGTDEPTISADGLRVAFEDDTGGARTAIVASTVTGTEIDSVAGVGEANPVRDTFGTGRPHLSPDGDWLVYAREGDIVLRALADGEETLVTAGAKGFATQPEVSSDGRFVTFESSATNLVAADTDGFIDIYRAEIDPATGAVLGIELVSGSAAGVTGNGDSVSPSISDDGRFIAFRSAASNLAGGDVNGIPDIFVKDMETGLVQRIELNGDSTGVIPQRSFFAAPEISGNGAFVAYTSDLVLDGEDLIGGQVYVAPVGFGAPLGVADVLGEPGPAPATTSAPSLAPVIDLGTLVAAPPDPAV